MEKNRCMGTKPIGNVLRNTFLVMRLTVIFVCLFVLGGRASVLSQYRVNVKLGETTYKHLFEEIRKQMEQIQILCERTIYCDKERSQERLSHIKG